MNAIELANTEEAVAELLKSLAPAGLDPNEPGLEETPLRVAKAYLLDLLSGYRTDVESLFKVFDGESYDEMVIVRDIPFYSLCEHHMVPFFGRGHIAYIPNGKIIGLSKLPRLLAAYSRRLTVQERITDQIVQALEDYLQPIGSMCVLEARHLCMEARGIRAAGATTTTSSVRGAFKDTTKGARQEFLNMIQQRPV